jgi:hypothetical protein
MTDPPYHVVAFLDTYPPNVRDVALQLRQMIMSTIPDVQETVDRPARIIGYGFGPRYADTICTIIPSKTGVKLGIVRGAELSDPRSLLTGKGKVHRHVPLTALADVKKPGLKRLLEAAFAAWKMRRKAEG